MDTKLRALGVLALGVVLAAIIGVNGMPAGAADEEPRFITPTSPPQQPVLNYDVTGSTLAGMIHLRLSVYDSGLATISEAGFFVFDPPDDGECPSDGKADFAFVGPEVVKALRDDLKNAGAFKATNGGVASDVPLQTVTVFAGRAPDQKAHSFTFYWANSQEIQNTLEVINAFIDEYFPGY